MAIPPALIDEIRDRADLLAVVGDYVTLRKAGRNWTGLCPFHSDKKTPSFSVSPEKGLFYCFGCGAGGDVFGFLRRVENLSFNEAAERLAQRFSVEIPRRPLTREEQSRKEDKERLAALVEDAAVFYHRMLTKDAAGEEGRLYLKKRAIDIDLARSFRMGWAPREWDSLHSFLASKGYSPRDMEKAGMAVERNSGGYYDRFRGRIMFPIMSVQGRVLGFGGRLVADEEGAKYMNSPESPLYSKSRVLYGISHAHKAMRDNDSAIIVEGYFDVLAMAKNGFENVVAPCGTALTVEQVGILTRYTKNIYPLFDADEAGDKARMKALEVILSAGAVGRSISLPSGMDPDDFMANNGREAMEKLVADARPLLETAFDKILAKSGTDVEGRAKAMTAIAELLAMMSDLTAREIYMREFASRLGMAGSGAEDLLRREVNKFSKGTPAQKSASVRETSAAGQGAGTDMPDFYLIVLIMTHPVLKGAMEDDEDLAGEIEDPELAGLFTRIIKEGAPATPSAYLDSVDPGRAAILSRLIMEEPEEVDDNRLKKIWAETVRRIRLKNIKRLKEEVQARIAGAGPNEIEDLIRRKNELVSREKTIRDAGVSEEIRT